MKKKFGILVGVVVAMLVVAAATFTIIKFKSNTPSPSPTPDTSGDTLKDEETIKKEQEEKLNNAFDKAKSEKESELEKIVVEYMKNEYIETDPWNQMLKEKPEGFTISLSLEKLKEKGYDMTKFHTDEADCDESLSFGVLHITVGNKEYSANLYCTYSFKSNENFEIIK